jgi:hypothetical protein
VYAAAMRGVWKAFVAACLLAVPVGLAAKGAVLRVEEASIGVDGLVRLRWTGEKEMVMARDRGGNCEDGANCEDAGASQLAVSSNRRSVGWTADYNGCCQSYPMPQVLVIARGGRVVHRLSGMRPIYGWQFEQGDALVAFFTDTPHGNLFPECELYDTGTWKKVDEWHPGKSAEMPEWVRPFARDMDPDGGEGSRVEKKSPAM